MGAARKALLWISENRRIRQSLPKYQFVRRAVSRFMPGEELEDAMEAAGRLQNNSINTIFTHLGENVTDLSEAKQVADHYLGSLKKIRSKGLDTHISVKLTQLGLDLGEDVCLTNFLSIVEQAKQHQTIVWIDMEQSQYVDRTVHIFREARKKYSNVGLCLQAYLRRCEDDIKALLPLSPKIRLVKGAYLESPAVAFPRKADVNENYFKLSKILLSNIKENKVGFGVATHDRLLIGMIRKEAENLGLGKKDYEFQLLYGVQAEEQLRLAKEGYNVRTLISYGTFWFPWYVRRLAERPANVWFVVKNMMRIG